MIVTNGFTRNVSAIITMNDQGSDPRIAQAAEAIRSADALLIGAGAGLSAAAGYDFTTFASRPRSHVDDIIGIL